MIKTLHAIFDGKVLVPEKPIDLEPNAYYEITIGKKIIPSPSLPDLWDLLEEVAGTIEGPSDWSLEHDHYLYGVPKQSKK